MIPDEDTVKKVMSEFGKVGGARKSTRKSEACRKNLEIARAKRWAGQKPITPVSDTVG